MLPRALAMIFLFGSIILSGKLIYDGIIFQFWTTQWVIGTLSIFVLISLGVAFLFHSNKETGYKAIAVFGLLYCFAAIIIYITWSYRHISETLSLAEYFGYLVLFGVAIIISFISIEIYIKEARNITKDIYHFPAWGFALPNVIIIFAVIWKYISSNVVWEFWPFIGEIFIIIIGSISFLISYSHAENI